jgi:beta-aspartyl-peptidase (threonine type)
MMRFLRSGMGRRQRIPALLWISVLLMVHACRPPAEVSEADFEKEIQSVLQMQVEAWNREELTAFMETYWKSPELTFISGGSLIRGWQATLERYRARYQEDGQEMGALDFGEVQIEVLGPAAAFVTGQYRLRRNSGLATGRFTLILRQLAGRWQIVHDHTSSSP